MPFATRIASGGGDASYRGIHSETSNNYVWANYGGSQAFDNDDGMKERKNCTSQGATDN
jgi:hypothetical protein